MDHTIPNSAQHQENNQHAQPVPSRALQKFVLTFTPKPLRARVLKHWNFLFYSLIGVSGASLDYLVFFLLHAVAGFDKYWVNALSVTLGISNNFLLNAFLNFQSTNRLARRFLYFYGVGILGLVLSIVLLHIGVDLLQMNAPLVKFLSIFAIVLLQYNINKILAFGKTAG